MDKYSFEKQMDGIFDEAYFDFLEKYKKDPSAAETYLRYLKDVLFLDVDQTYAMFVTYDEHSVCLTQDSSPVTKSFA